MKTSNFFLVTFLISSFINGKSQTADFIVQKHLRNTSKSSWLDVTSIYEQGDDVTIDKTYKFKKFMKFPNLIRVELDYGDRSSLFIRNSDDDDLLKKYGFPSPPRLINNSLSLSKREFYGLHISEKSDTIIADTLFHRLKVTQKLGDFISNSIYYFDHERFYLQRIDCIDPQYISSTQFSDFRWVSGYIFPFRSKTQKFGRDYSSERIAVIRVNEEFKTGIFDSQRE